MKLTLLGALSFIGIAMLVVLVFGPEDGFSRRWGTEKTAIPNAEQIGSPESDARTGLRAPDSETPAAGVCDGSTGVIVSVTINEDVPSPRCIKISAGQKLRVENRTMERITVSFEGTTNADASREHSIIPGDGVLIDVPAETYLMPGVHHLNVTGYSSPEIWFGAPEEGSPESRGQ